ncbi:uncharacterized protein LOC129974847 [Argiope bruennichi]|uniref:uncharacterized protein LOC129974847 n=1 Tax=Argiope bruennichi TaxID=94029 RepID=UPI0024951880|nr:uncharacterized protein LOC129974847 [Argiope bruennichi]
MAIKFSFAILSFLSVFLISQGLKFNPEDLHNYYKCWINAVCFTDGPDAGKLLNCFNKLTPEELQSCFQLIKNNYFNYKSDDIFGAIKELCHFDDAKRQYAYNKTVDGIIETSKKVCGDSDKTDDCSRDDDFLTCLYDNMNQLKQMGKCN